MKGFDGGINLTAVLGIILVIVMLLMCLLPFFTLTADNIITGESQQRASGYQSIFGIICKKSDTNKSGMDFAVSLYDNEDTRGAMTVLGIAGLIALISALTLLILNIMTICGKVSMASIARAIGVLLILASLLTLIMGFVVAANASSLDLGAVASSNTMASFGLWAFSILGIGAGCSAFAKPYIKRRV